MLSFPLLGRSRSWAVLVSLSVLSLLALPLLVASPAYAQYPGGGSGGGYPGGGGGYGGPVYSGGKVTLTSSAPPNPQPIAYTYYNDGSWGGGYYASGSSDAHGANITSGTATCSGAITATFTWNNGGDPNNKPPKCVVITEHCTAGWSGEMSNGGTVSGGCTNPLGGSSVPNVPGPGAEWDYTRYTVQNNPPATLTVSCSPEAHADSSGSGTPSSNAVGGGSVSYSVSVSPVTIGLEGVTIDPSDKSLHVLTGGQVTAFLNAPFTASNFSWSFTGATGYNPFYDWDSSAPNSINPTQFIPIPSAYLAQSSISFYDAADQDALTVHCAATLTPPSGPPLNVNVASKLITYHKPSVSWTVNVPYNGYSTGFFNGLPNGPFGAQELWGPMTITVPLPFDTTSNPGFGAILQIATLGRSNTRTPLNGKPSTYSKLSVLSE